MRTLFYKFFVIITIAVFSFGFASLSFSQTVEEIQQNISSTTDKIKKLELEIKQYANDIEKTATLKKTLNNLIKQLDLTRKKLETEIRITSTKVDGTDLKIRQLNSEILYKENKIESYRASVTEALRIIYEYDGSTLTEIVLSNQSFSDLWNDIEAISQFNDKVQSSTEILRDLKSELENNQELKQVEKKNLLNLKAELGDRKKITEENKSANARLLAKTNNDEVAFQKLLREAKALKDSFEKELTDYESQLMFLLDPTSIPTRGTKVFSSPLPDVTYTSCYGSVVKAINCLTQFFGKTIDSVRLYASGTHNGIDFRASVGTLTKATLSGTVIGTGDTDLTCSGASYGRWVLIRHNNGLSTLYAHLSLINVSEGQTVSTGQKIGYTGNTGYSTGPHLHLTVFASLGVSVKTLPSKSCGGRIYTIPLAAANAYLDPMDYL